MGKPLIAATVVETGNEAALGRAHACAPFADLVEFRLDYLVDPDPVRLVRESPLPVIATCRPARAGGRFDGPERERIDLLRRSIDAGAAWVDVELDAAGALGDPGKSRRIVSWHDFAGTPPDLESVLERIRAHGPDVAKVVPTAHVPVDVVRVLDLLRQAKLPLAAHPMGRAGFPGRILAARYGSAILYGAAGRGAAGAPGQPTVRQLREDYRLDRDLRDADTILLLGGSLAHSVSPRMLNRSFAEWGANALYVPWEGEDADGLLALLDGLGAAGAAVTIPLKEAIAARLEGRVDPAARDGAVNTVFRRGGRWTGTSTDGDGAVDPIRSVAGDLAGRRALVLGAGGAARAIVRSLVDAGAFVTIVNRTAPRAERLAAEVGGTAAALTELDPGGIDLVVNATPVGQWPDVGESPLPDDFLMPGMVVLDAVYNPRETRLLAAARARGGRAIPGIEMLAGQAARQVPLWLGREAPVDRLLAEGEAALAAREERVLLVGMRGAGKSTVGPLVAVALGRRFVDLDDEIEAAAGAPISALFEREGEDGFRRREVAALRAALDAPGGVLALGGGALASATARALVSDVPHRTVFLQVPAPVLVGRLRGSDRPALTGLPLETEVEELLREREPVYRSVSDLTVDAEEGGAEAVADRVLEALERGG